MRSYILSVCLVRTSVILVLFLPTKLRSLSRIAKLDVAQRMAPHTSQPASPAHVQIVLLGPVMSIFTNIHGLQMIRFLHTPE